MDLTQFPEPLRKTFQDMFNALENVHSDYPEVVIKFLRLLILKYGLGAELCESKEYANGCVQTDDAQEQEETETRVQGSDPPPDVQEQQVWDLKSLAEDVRAVAQETLNLNQSQSFIYDDKSGTYYNYEQQCYYIPQHKLYYYVQNKAYYTYDEENHCMKFYSSSDHSSQNHPTPDATTDSQANSSKNNYHSAVDDKLAECGESSKQIIPTKQHKPSRPKDDELEEGEIADSDEEEEGELRDEDADYGYINVESPQPVQSATPSVIMASPTRIDLNVEPVDHCAPCVRITVRKSNIKGLDVGQLFIITRSGGTLGRDGQHDILLPDSNVSKEHLSFHYKYSEGIDVYEIVDCSRNGTVLDGVSLEQNKPYRLGHGSVLNVGSTTLLCHIHDGTNTCEECEPSCLGFMNSASPPPMPATGSLRTRHAAEMSQIKRKFGLNGSSLVPKLPKGYEDKSKIRRETVGSSHDSEKTDAGSTEEPIRSDNKGYAMLSKMGWKKGEGVGKSGEGTKSPVNVTVKMSKRGLGCPEDDIPHLPKPKTKLKALEITKKRYEECE